MTCGSITFSKGVDLAFIAPQYCVVTRGGRATDDPLPYQRTLDETRELYILHLRLELGLALTLASWLVPPQNRDLAFQTYNRERERRNRIRFRS